MQSVNLLFLKQVVEVLVHGGIQTTTNTGDGKNATQRLDPTSSVIKAMSVSDETNSSPPKSDESSNQVQESRLFVEEKKKTRTFSRI